MPNKSVSKEGGKVRTRIAPSPTGPLHIGTARSALFNFVFAKQQKGSFILRIEDTDLERSDPVFEQDIKEGLEWLGINWDEFYRQSERLDIYEKYLKKLLTDELIFWCGHSQEELSLERKEQFLKKEPMRHICSFRDGSFSPQKNDGILRFKNNFEGRIVFNDLIRGQVGFESGLLGDFSVAKNLRTPLYNFAVVIDDREMAISHVMRGEDHVSNTPKQILLQRALGFAEPNYAHLPLILGTDRSKLSKREGAVSVLEYRRSGYMPEAMVNFMILLGWHPAPLNSARGKPRPEKEIFTFKDILKGFSLERVQKGGAVFDLNKLKWLNTEYIKKLKAENLAEQLKKFVPDLSESIKTDPKKWLKISELLRKRLTTLNEAGELGEYFYKEPHYPKEMLSWKNAQSPENILRHLRHILEVLSGASNWGADELETKLTPYAEKEGLGKVLWPFRVALSGRIASAGPYEIAEILGKEESIKRVKSAIGMLE